MQKAIPRNSGHSFRFFLSLTSLIGGILFLLVIPSLAMANNKIGVVDVVKAYKGTDLGKAIQAHLNHFQNSLTAPLTKERKNLQVEQKTIKKHMKTLGKAQLRSRILKYRQMVLKYRQHLLKVRKQIFSENILEIRTFLKALTLATVAVGKQGGYQMVLSQHPIRLQGGPFPLPFRSLRFLYLDSKSDLTDPVVQYVNKNFHPVVTHKRP